LTLLVPNSKAHSNCNKRHRGYFNTLILSTKDSIQQWFCAAALLVSTVITRGFWSKLLSGDSAVEWLLAMSLAVALICFRVRFEE
jgi:hypothetical protein